MKEISLNFGAIKESALRYSSKQFLNENKHTVNDFAKEIQSNPILKKQHLIYKIFENAKPFTKEHLAERFINQSFRIFEGLKWKDIQDANEALRKKFLGENHVGSTSGKDEIYNAINTLIESKCHSIDPVADQQAYETVLVFIMESPEESPEEQKTEEELNETQEHPKVGSWKYITNLAVTNFNKRYEHLEEEDRKLLKVLLSPNSYKSNYLEDLKQENLGKIESMLSENPSATEAEALQNFKSKLEKIDSQKTTQMDEAIISCFELRSVLGN
jgi:hypothetical protein